MKLTISQKQDFQCFVYFLFSRHFDPKLIGTEYQYLDKILANRDLLYNCFELFAFAEQKNILSKRYVTDYLLSLNVNTQNEHFDKLLQEAKTFNHSQMNIWNDFLILSKWYCYNTFPDAVKVDYLLEINGTDAVPTFALWTNVVEVDENLSVLNSNEALKRANERIKCWDGEEYYKKFSEWELDQEIY